jgi:hypothetical protein
MENPRPVITAVKELVFQGACKALASGTIGSIPVAVTVPEWVRASGPLRDL